MTPERAEELADGYVHLSSGIRESFSRTILAACREERHAALTEAAYVARTDAIICRDILALRDKGEA